MSTKISGEHGRNGGYKTLKKNYNDYYDYVFTGNHAKKDGGVFLNKGSSTLSVSNCTFKENYTSDRDGDNKGGAIKTDSTVIVTNCDFDGNYAYATERSYSLRPLKKLLVDPSRGGAICVSSSGSLTSTNSNYKNGSANQGGAIYSDSTVTIKGGVFQGNQAVEDTVAQSKIKGVIAKFVKIVKRDDDHGGNGGALNVAGKTTVSDATFSGNDAYDNGGAIYNYDGGTLTVKNSTFTDNMTYTGDGGAIFCLGGGSKFSIDGCTFTLNSVGNQRERAASSSKREFDYASEKLGYGGAIYNAGDEKKTVIGKIVKGYVYNEASVSNTTFSQNSATGQGGAICNTQGGGLTITNCSFKDNEAGISCSLGLHVKVIKIGIYRIPIVTHNRNYVGGLGGAICNTLKGAIIVNGSNTFSHNTADREGGAIYNDNDDNAGTHPTSFGDAVLKVLNFGGDDIVHSLRVKINERNMDKNDMYSRITFDSDVQFNNNAVVYDDSCIDGSFRYGWDCVGGAISNTNDGVILFEKNTGFSGNKAEDFGGAVSNRDDAVMVFGGTTKFSDNLAGKAGGAIFNDGGYVYISGNAAFINNKADSSQFKTTIRQSVSDYVITNCGGAIYNEAGTIFLDGITIFSGNSASKLGGAIYNAQNTLFERNKPTISFSSKIFLRTDSDTIYNGRGGTLNWVLNNTSTQHSGYINHLDRVTNQGTLSITVNSQEIAGQYYVLAGHTGTAEELISANKGTYTLTTGKEGASTATITVNGDSVSYNGYTYTLKVKTITYDDGEEVRTGNFLVLNVGGDITGHTVVSVENFPATDGVLTTNGKFTGYGKTVQEYGGAFLVESDGTLNMRVSSCSDNSGISGGVIYNEGVTTVRGTIFDGNSTSGDGGAIYNVGTLTVNGITVFKDNISTGNGGAVYNAGKFILSGKLNFTTTVDDAKADTIYNAEGGEFIWDIENQYDYGYLTDWSKLINHANKLYITGSSETKSGKYRIAGNAAAANGQAFEIRNAAGEKLVDLTVGGNAVSYGDLFYAKLTVVDEVIDNVQGTSLYFTIIPQRIIVSKEEGTPFATRGGTCTLAAATMVLDGAELGENGQPKVYDGDGGIIDVRESGTILNTFGEESSYTFKNFAATGNGGVIINAGIITVDGFIFSGNTAGKSGGAIYSNATGKEITLANAVFAGNTATQNGGAFASAAGSVTIDNGTFTDNIAGNCGGALYNANGSTLTLGDVTFSGNTAKSGGAIHNNGALTFTGNITLETASDTIFNGANGTIKWVVSTDSNGFLSDYSLLRGNTGNNVFTLDVDDSIETSQYLLAQNAENAAGVTFTAGTTSLVVDGKRQNAGNDLFYKLYLRDASDLVLDISSRIIVKNQETYTISDGLELGEFTQVQEEGGAIQVKAGGTLNSEGRSVFTGNGTIDGHSGGAIANMGGTVTLANVLFSGNTADGGSTAGGALVNGWSSSVMTLTNCVFEDNKVTNSTRGGGAIYNDCTLTIADSAFFSGNSANIGKGGAIYNAVGGTLNVAGEVTLDTETDTIYNAGKINWDLSGDYYGFISDYARVTDDNGTYFITLRVQSTDPESEEYKKNMTPGQRIVLAENAETANGKIFTITSSDTAKDDVNITVNGNEWIKYDGVAYKLMTEYIIEDPEAPEDNHWDLYLCVSNSRIVVNKANYPSDGIYELSEGERFMVDGAYVGNEGGGAMLVEADGTLQGAGAEFCYNNTNYGGALSNRGIIEVSDLLFDRNTAKVGGGVYSISGSITLSDTTFFHNIASQAGGAIYLSMAELTLDNVTFTGNTAGIKGGAIYAGENSVINLTGLADFQTDTDTVYMESGKINWVLTDNTHYGSISGFDKLSWANGAAKNLSITVSDMQAEGSYTLASGSDDYSNLVFILTGLDDEKTITIGDSNLHYGQNLYSLTQSGNDLILTITANRVTQIIVEDGETEELTNDCYYCVPDSEKTEKDLGAIVVKQGGTLTGNGTEKTSIAIGYNNGIASGAGLDNQGCVTLDQVFFYGNTVTSAGGAVYNHNGGTMTLSNARFDGNVTGDSSSGDGSAIDNCGATLTLNSVGFTDNHAFSSGAIRNRENATLIINDVTFDTNYAYTGKGGAIYNEKDSIVTLTGNLTLTTMQDSFYNEGTLNWDISGDNAGYLTNVQYLDTNVAGGKLAITVNAEETIGTVYELACGDFTVAQSKEVNFTLTGVDGEDDVVITLGGEIVAYNGNFYQLSVHNNGTTAIADDDRLQLKVVSALTITMNDAVKDYDGTALSESGYTLTGELEEGDELVVTSSGSITDAGSCANTVTDYRILRDGEDVTRYYKVTTVDGTLTVNQRNVTIRSGSARKLYDGTELTNNTMEVDGDLFAAGEGFSFVVTGSRTEIGKSTNDFSYALTQDTKAENYDITTEYGTLTVAGEHAVNSDIDGNGISDVVFQWVGAEVEPDPRHDYRLGYWMNGTSDWRSDRTALTENWTPVNTKDIDSDGESDVVMFGKTSDTEAVIGYYGSGYTENWHLIGTVSDPDNWEVTVGNVTGHVTGGVENNSIILHSKTTGDITVWKDSSPVQGITLSGYGGSWHLVGTGDFTDSGEEKIVLSFGGNLYTTNLNNKFEQITSGWNESWEARAIGDFSNDGKDDIVIFDQESGSMVKINDGNGDDWEKIGQLDAEDWFIVGAGDYDGDQKDDLLVRQYSTGMLGYYQGADQSKWVELGRGVDMNWAVIA